MSVTNMMDLFHNWKLEYGKLYATRMDENRAFRVWQENLAFVNSVNSANLSWTAQLGKYGDVSTAEFIRSVLLPTRELKPIPPRKTLTKGQTRPAEFDWRSKTGVVTTVKDQGSVGSCWAFSTVGNIEGQWSLYGNAGSSGLDLSPEFLVDCDGSHDDKHADCSVFGGWPYLAYGYVIESGGIPSEASWPYCSGTGDCYPCMQGPVSLCGPPPYYCDDTIEKKCPNAVKSATISDWTSVSTDENVIADTLYSQGPLSVLLDATQLQFYKGGIWTGHTSATSPLLGCTKTGLNHAVLLTGFGSENGVDYWTVKNSWGIKWGEEGYFRITRGSGTCGINTGVTTALV